MRRAWEHYEPIPSTTALVRPDGERAVIPLEEPRDGELVVRVLGISHADRGGRGAVVEIVAVQEKDPLVLGDRLWLFDRASCGHCEICRRGHGTSCPDYLRSFLPLLDVEHLVVPSWIAKRGSVRLPEAASTSGALALGSHAWILRALRLHAPGNPLRVLVLGGGEDAAFLGALLETRWPDARRVLRSPAPAPGYHGVALDPEALLEGLGQGADLVVCLEEFLASELSGLVAPGVHVVQAGEGSLVGAEGLSELEATVASSRGAQPVDLEAFRRQFAAFCERWDSQLA